MTGVNRSSPFARWASLGASSLALVGGLLSAPATAQQADDAPERRSSYVTHSWSIDSSLFYSDNFQRSTDEAIRFDQSIVTLLPDGAGGFAPFVGTQQETVEIDPLDNTILAATLTGSTLLRRPSLSGLISGSVRVGTFFNTDDVNDRLLEQAPAPAEAEFDLPDGEVGTLALASSTFGRPDRDDVFIDPNLRGVATIKAIENLFYVDLNGLVQEQSIGLGGAGAQSGVGQSSDEILYGGLSVSPYLLRIFGNDSSVELRGRVTAIEVLDQRISIADPTLTEEEREEAENAQINNDSRSVEALADYQSGDLFDRFSFRAGALARRVEEDGSDLETVQSTNFDQFSGSFDVSYAINRTFSLTGGVGVDEVIFDDPDALLATATETEIEQRDEEIAAQEFQEDELSGLFWRVGFDFTPSRRSRLSATFGERYGGTSINLNGSYRPSQRIVFTAAATRQLNSNLQDFASNTFSLQGQALGLLTSLSNAQTLTSRALLQRALSFEGSSFRNTQTGQIGVAAINRVRLGMRGQFQRTNIGLSVDRAESERQNSNDEQWNAEALFSRQISRRLSANASLRYSSDEAVFAIEDLLTADDIDTLPVRAVEETFGSIGLAYQVGPRLSVTGQIYRAERNSDGDRTGSGTFIDYVENAAGIGVRWTF